MWKLNKPDINKAISEDVDKLIYHCKSLATRDKSDLKSLYTNYDNQRGLILEPQLGTIKYDKAMAISHQYAKTRKGYELGYIRSELMADVDLCPYCSINSVSELDHFAPKSKYPALAVCRMNLVPLCGVCNRGKSNDSFKLYIHAYYDTFPSVPFLIANISILKSRFVVAYNFDSTAINNSKLTKKLNYQATKIGLWDRLEKSTNNFINDLFCGCEVTNIESLIIWLKSRLSYYEMRFGLNDWRCAVIRGILVCNGLDINMVNNYKINPQKLNGGAGA